MTSVITRALVQSGLHPSRLEIEVTESLMLSNSGKALSALKEIQKLGIRVAMDDFGTGFSSLSCLTLFPFDKMKVDQSFVRELGKREDCHAIVKAATGLAKSLHMRTTAEGIETARQLLEVRAVGCTEGQGYLFGRPMPLAEAEAMAHEGNLSWRLA
jgi:EAL domain-containing protein (putative c-di-GMP-specific phosphodiesterase class I)